MAIKKFFFNTRKIKKGILLASNPYTDLIFSRF